MESEMIEGSENTFEFFVKEVWSKGIPCFINGIPEEDGGKIKEIRKDKVVFEVKEVDKNNPENGTVEEIVFQLRNIVTVSTGKKKIGSLNATIEKNKEE